MNMLPREVHHPVHQQTESLLLRDFLQSMGMLHLQQLLYQFVDLSSCQSNSQAVRQYENITIQQSFSSTVQHSGKEFRKGKTFQHSKNILPVFSVYLLSFNNVPGLSEK